MMKYGWRIEKMGMGDLLRPAGRGQLRRDELAGLVLILFAQNDLVIFRETRDDLGLVCGLNSERDVAPLDLVARRPRRARSLRSHRTRGPPGAAPSGRSAACEAESQRRHTCRERARSRDWGRPLRCTSCGFADRSRPEKRTIFALQNLVECGHVHRHGLADVNVGDGALGKRDHEAEKIILRKMAETPVAFAR